MYFVDVPKLIGRMHEKGYNQTTFSKALGINRNTLRLYLSDYTRIPYETLSKMAAVLSCDFDDATRIFFAQKLA